MCLTKSKPAKDTVKVLHLDDNPKSLKTIQFFLEFTGAFSVQSTDSPSSFWQALDPGDLPDLFLLDVDMPCEDGGSIALKLREHRAFKDVPIVFLTGLAGRNSNRPMNKTQQLLCSKCNFMDDLIPTLCFALRTYKPQLAAWVEHVSEN